MYQKQVAVFVMSTAAAMAEGAFTTGMPRNGTALFPTGKVPGERNGTIAPETWSPKCVSFWSIGRALLENRRTEIVYSNV